MNGMNGIRVLRTAFAALLVGTVLLATGVQALAQSPQIRASWNNGVLNVSVSGLPPNALVELTVHDDDNNQMEQPNGSPPPNADGTGNWPGEANGTETGYPGTSNDSGGTRYTICVRVNGATGPCTTTQRPRGLLACVFHAVLTFGGLFGQGDAVPDAAPVA